MLRRRSGPSAPTAGLDDDALVMAAFRQTARGRGWIERDAFYRDAARHLGFLRVGRRIRERLKGHMRAALRRGILIADGDLVRGQTLAMSDYTREALRDALRSVMRKEAVYEREDAIRAVAQHLGFSRITETVRAPVKSAINSAIRQGILEYEGSRIRRIK